MILLIVALIIIFIIGYSASAFFLEDKAGKIEILPMSFVVGLIMMGYFILFASIATGSFSFGIWLFMALGGVYSLYFGFKNFGRLKGFADLKNFNADLLAKKIKKISWLETFFFILFLVFFFDIFSKTIFYQDGAYKVAAAGYGDIPFHMAEVSYFIHNTPFGLEEPIYSGSRLVYAFLINFLSSIFYVISGNYILSFNLPSYILLLAGFFFIYKFISAFLKTAAMRILAFLILFLGSGASFARVFQDNALREKSSIGEMLNYLLHLPYLIVNFFNAVYPAQNVIWTDFITMFLTHQRSFFFGFAAGAMILHLLSLAFKSNNPLSPRLQRTRKYFYFIGLLTGFLPLVHMHTFIAVLIIIFGFFIWKKLSLLAYTLLPLPYSGGGDKVRVGVLPDCGGSSESEKIINNKLLLKNLFNAIGIGAVIGAVITYFFILDLSSGASLIKYRLGWMSEPGIGSILYNPAGGSPIWAWFSYLWENFGLFFPLLVAAIIYFIYKEFFELFFIAWEYLSFPEAIKNKLALFKDRFLGLISVRKNDFWQKKDPVFGLIIGAILLFIVINTIQFQPWDYDNGKIFGYLYILGSIIIVYFFEQWKFRFAKIIVIVLAFFLIFVGLIDTFSRSSLANPPFYDIFTPNDQKAADWIVKNIDSKDVILTGTSHLNPVNSLAGRPVLVGYPGWLWSHGIKYGGREKDIHAIYRGESDAKELLKKYNIKYIFAGSSERAISGFNEQFFDQNYQIVFQEGSIKIFKTDIN